MDKPKYNSKKEKQKNTDGEDRMDCKYELVFFYCNRLSILSCVLLISNGIKHWCDSMMYILVV